MKNTGTLTIATPGDTDIVIVRQVDAPRALVFDAYTKRELVRRWLLGPPGWTMPVCEIDLRPGGRYRYVWRSDGGQDMELGGVYREIWKPDKIVNTEQFVPDWTAGETLCVLELTEASGRTTITHTITYGSADARAAAVATGMTEGMAAGFDRLEGLLAELRTETG